MVNMTPQQQAAEERRAALTAVDAALGASGQLAVCRAAVRRWPKFDGATAGDILEHTYDYDTFCAEAELFFEVNPGWSEADWGPALNYVLDALVLMDLPRDVPHVSDLLQRAGVMEPPDDSQETYDPAGDTVRVLAWAARQQLVPGYVRDALRHLGLDLRDTDEAETQVRAMFKGES